MWFPFSVTASFSPAPRAVLWGKGDSWRELAYVEASDGGKISSSSLASITRGLAVPPRNPKTSPANRPGLLR
ncbi:hypothetical protein DRJ54_03720 [Candidatus Acetothermia bacterium]|nr:MAG: hypothetical protein DRJ54_03720 [Candidatus Acetothermia bacterium]